MASPTTDQSVLRRLGVQRLVNASGIYTDLGGSCLSPTIWEALAEMNGAYTSLPELFDRSGELIAGLVGAPAARVVPGASAGIALMVAACIARGDGTVSERLPGASGRANQVLFQARHNYHYARCVLLGGGELVACGSESETSADDLATAIGPDTAAILFPAHLDGESGTLTLEEVAAVAGPHGVPIIVDAAYMSYPLELIGSYTARGADLACFSAKYFYGPNAGGFVVGSPDAVSRVRAVDFTEYESGPFRNFGRGFKMDRTTVVATWLALEEWYAIDHEARWASYARRVERAGEAMAAVSHVDSRPCLFTLDNRAIGGPPINGLAMRSTDGGRDVDAVSDALLAGDPSILCSRFEDALVLCVETLDPDEDEMVIERVRAAWGA